MWILLWLVVTITIGFMLVYHRRISIVTAAAAGLFTYSVPALVGLTSPVTMAGMRYSLQPAAPEGVFAMALAWLGFLLALIIASTARNQHRATPVFSPMDNPAPSTGRFANICAVLSVAIVVVMMFRGGAFFFLQDRSSLSQNLDYGYLLWRWCNVLGLLTALQTRRRGLQLLFVGMIGLNFLIGDRTSVVIAAAAVAVLFLWNRPFSKIVFSGRVALGAVALLAFIFIAKPLYVSVKTGIPLSLILAGGDGVNTFAAAFEPFGTHYLLEAVISHGLRISTSSILLGCVGQLLVMPSFFGIDSSQYNQAITQTLFPTVSYGLAFNFWAQGYSWLEFAGVFIFGVLFGALALGFNYFVNKSKGAGKSIAILCGVLIAVYIHRNSMENMLSFLRQVLMVAGPVWVLAMLINLSARPRAALTHRIGPVRQRAR